MTLSAAMMRAWSAAGTRLRLFRARLLTAMAQLMAELLQRYKLALGKLLVAFLDCGDLVSRRKFLRQTADLLSDIPGLSRADVMPQRLAHQFGASPMFLSPNTLELVRHFRRERYGKRGGSAINGHDPASY